MSKSAVHRPRRWDVSFSMESGQTVEMTEDDVDRILTLPPFRDLDPSGFKRTLPLRDILRNDARFVDYEPGDVIVRRGDWGSSAFYVVLGSVRVELEREDSTLQGAILGQRESRRKPLFETVAQLWRNHREPEVRIPAANETSGVAKRHQHGVVRIYLPDVSAVIENYQTTRLEAGHWFGELAALGRTRRVATVFAEEPSMLMEIRWQGLRDILRYDRTGSLKRFIEDIFRRRALTSFLRSEPLFSGISDSRMERIFPHCPLQTFGDYDSAQPFKEMIREGSDPDANEPVIVEEGDYPNGVILIRSGLARISCTHHNGRRTTGYLNPGRAFGFEEILHGWKSGTPSPYDSRLSAIGYLNSVLVPTFVIEGLLEDGEITVPDSVLPERGSQPTSSRGIDENLLNFLVDRHYVQGTATMVIDLNRCTRCDDCVRACAATHDNNPRFIRHGPTSGRYMIANACLHCLDPVCMIECPTAAIHRDRTHGLVVINEQTCIGCSQCANNCPFDAIRMVELRNPSGEMVVDAKNTPLLEATKCDLCMDQLNGPACQNACPHDALRRVDMQEAASLEKALSR